MTTLVTYCPKCGQKTMKQTIREDFCSCGYSVYYRDAYAEEPSLQEKDKNPSRD